MKKYFVALTLLIISHSAYAQKTLTVVDEHTGKEEVIDLPEGMLEEEIDSMMRQWYASTYLAYDSASCESNGEDIAYEPEEYIRRLQYLPNVIEMPYNSVVRKFIDQYSGRLRRSIAMMLGASNFYNPIFEDALEAYQLPLELKYLPIIESALNPNATSKAGAGGLWQFMPATGKRYGLEITSLIDERRDPIKASYAAARMLKSLYEIFGDWTLVIASYNCGPGNVNKAIKRANKGTDYWAIYNYLPRETRGYVPAFIAVNYAMEYATDLYNICPSESKMPTLVDTVMVSDRMHFEQIAANMPITVEQLRKLNPQYKLDIIPAHKKPCAIVFPVNDTLDFIAAKDSILEYEKEKYAKRMETAVVLQTTYKIRSGDNLWDIAKKKGTTVAAIRKANPGKNLNVLRIGQVINLPVR